MSKIDKNKLSKKRQLFLYRRFLNLHNVKYKQSETINELKHRVDLLNLKLAFSFGIKNNMEI